VSRRPAATPARSLRRSSRWAALGAVIVAVVGVLVGVRAVDALSDARRTLVDDIDEAVVEASDLKTAAVDQFIGVRVHALAGDPAFEEFLVTGRQRADVALERLEGHLERLPAMAPALRRAGAALQTWQDDHAASLLASEPGTSDASTLDAARRAFTEARTAIDDLRAELLVLRESARDDLDQAARRLTVTLVVLAGLAIAVVLGVWIALHRAVLSPLSRIVADARAIGEGDLSHPVRPVSGPVELAELATTVEAMRVELLAQIGAGKEREAELERSNAELEQFAYVASHDLQEPLRKVASFSQMLQRRYQGQLDDRADQYIAYAVDGAKRMQDLINDLLSFSRVGRTTERFVELDGDEVVDRAVRNLVGTIDDAHATVDRPDPLPRLVGDRSLLVALFQNLISNAIKFRSEAPPRVTITARELDDQVEFTVCDNGIGIAPEYRDRVFVIFQRLHTRDEYEGTGIGLALCRKIVEFHGGSIEVADQDGPGTRITFTLSRPQPAPADPTSQEALTV
jgi:signal transduction histidine kinase